MSDSLWIIQISQKYKSHDKEVSQNTHRRLVLTNSHTFSKNSDIK